MNKKNEVITISNEYEIPHPYLSTWHPDAPEWARYQAVDSIGSVWVYEEEPVPSLPYGWDSVSRDTSKKLESCYCMPNCPQWRDSLLCSYKSRVKVSSRGKAVQVVQ